MVFRDLVSHIQLMVISSIITMMLCVFALCYLVMKSGPSLLRNSFMVSWTVTILWQLFLILEWVSLTHDALLSNIRVSLICLNFIAPLWLITILFFTNRLSREKYWLIPTLLLIPFALSVVLILPESSDILKLYINELNLDAQVRRYFIIWGPLENITGIYSACCVSLSFWFLLKYLRKNNLIKPIEKITALTILWSPIVTHYLALSYQIPFDFKPLTFSLWGAVTIYLSLQRQFFNAVPSLVWNIFNITKEGMAVLGANGSVNLNKTFLGVFGPRSDDFIVFADELYAGLSAYINQKQEVIGLEAEKEGVYYEISIINVSGRKNKIVGQLITFNDVSATKNLTLEKERARISSGLHDSMGNRLIAIINNLTIASIQTTLEKTRPFVDTAAESASASLMMLRRIVEGLSPVNFQETRLVPMIESVINRISASGVYVDLQIHGDLEDIPSTYKEFIYSSCQEGLTNSVIHGKAENIVIKLDYVVGKLKFSMLDEGRGCEKIFKNNGLTTMESRAIKLGGKIRFESRSSGGFGIYSEFQIKAGEQ